MALSKPREVALKILYDVNQNGAYSNIAMNKYLEDKELKDADKGLVSEIVHGTLKWMLTIDYIIELYSKIKLKKLSPWILNILRIGIYQLLFVDRIPESAACNESVTLAKRYGHSSSSGYVNAILRNVARNKDSIPFPDENKDKIKFLSVKYSHPEWLVRKWLNDFGPEFTASLLKSNNEVPEFTIRANLLKTTKEKLAEALNEKGYITHDSQYIKEALIIENPSAFMHTDLFKQGYFQVQDESSMLVGKIIDPKPGDTVLDVCSAPGGKATHIAELMENNGQVIARDMFEHKVRIIRETAARLGTSIVKAELFDALQFDDSLREKADKVLVDAPCTGLGILRRKPEIRWNRELPDLTGITQMQFAILSTSAGYVKPGGILVYSTCTINREENEDLVHSFLKKNKEFIPEDISLFIPEKLVNNNCKSGYIQTYPNVNGIDGFFIAKMKRKLGTSDKA